MVGCCILFWMALASEVICSWLDPIITVVNLISLGHLAECSCWRVDWKSVGEVVVEVAISICGSLKWCVTVV